MLLLANLPIIYLRPPVVDDRGTRHPGGFWFLGITTKVVGVHEPLCGVPRVEFFVGNPIQGVTAAFSFRIKRIAIAKNQIIETVVIETQEEFEDFCAMAEIDDPACPLMAF